MGNRWFFTNRRGLSLCMIRRENIYQAAAKITTIKSKEKVWRLLEKVPSNHFPACLIRVDKQLDHFRAAFLVVRI